MISCETSFEDLPKDSSYIEVIDGLKDDRLSFSDVEGYLKKPNVTLHKLFVGERYIGFYSMEDGPIKESHLYIYPEARRHSVQAIRLVVRETPKPFLTSVYGTHMHVYKLLKRMGFLDYYTIPKLIMKDNEMYDLIYLVKKE